MGKNGAASRECLVALVEMAYRLLRMAVLDTEALDRDPVSIFVPCARHLCIDVKYQKLA